MVNIVDRSATPRPYPHLRVYAGAVQYSSVTCFLAVRTRDEQARTTANSTSWVGSLPVDQAKEAASTFLTALPT